MSDHAHTRAELPKHVADNRLKFPLFRVREWMLAGMRAERDVLSMDGYEILANELIDALCDAVASCSRGASAGDRDSLLGIADDLDRLLREPCDSNDRMTARRMPAQIREVVAGWRPAAFDAYDGDPDNEAAYNAEYYKQARIAIDAARGAGDGT